MGPTHNNPWLAIYIGLATTCVCTILVLFLPATRDVASLTRLARCEDAHIDDSDNLVSRLYSYGKSAARRLVSISRMVTVNNKRLGLLLLGAFPFYMSYNSPITMFYWTRRLHWSMSDVCDFASNATTSLTPFLLLTHQLRPVSSVSSSYGQTWSS